MAKSSQKTELVKKKNTAAVALAMLGASKGGKARAKKLSPQRRLEIARKASAARMKKISPERRREIALKASHSRRIMQKP